MEGANNNNNVGVGADADVYADVYADVDVDVNVDADVNTDADVEPNEVSKPQLTTRQKIVVGSFVISTVLEIILSKRGFLWTPSNILRVLSTSFLDVFSTTGNRLVDGSKIIAEYVSIKDLAIAIYNLLTPIGYLLISPYNIFVGISKTVQVDQMTAMIGLGTSFTLMAVTVLIAERRSNETFKPSHILSEVYKYSWNFYKFVGRIAADISSIYRVMHLDKVIEDAIKIATPATKLLIAPVKSVTEYFKEINISSYATAQVIFAGTITIASLFAYGYTLTRGY